MTNFKTKKTIGIFALQGSFAEHKKMMKGLGADVFLINSLSDVQNKRIDGVIIPGGESTTMKKLLKKTGLDKWLFSQGKNGLSIFGTCAGMIILADMGLIDADIERNAYGSQINSFEAELKLCFKFELKKTKFENRNSKKTQNFFPGIFIRAPKVKRVGSEVKVLAKHGDVPVLVRQKNIMIGSFHPELTEDTVVHEYFLKLVIVGY